MKRSTLLIGAIVACTFLSFDALAGQRRRGPGAGHGAGVKGPMAVKTTAMGGLRGNGNGKGGVSTSNLVSALNSQSDLVRMWEEEKLARDVYARLGDLTGMMIFRNITRSENQHMLALARVMQVRGSTSVSLNDTPGVFRFPDYQELYQTLVAEGSRGPLEALMVGAKIEEMDIADLQRMIAATSDRQLSAVLQHLLRGSQNHLRAFNSQITALGATYRAQFLTQSQYDQIATGGQSGRQGQAGPRGRGRGQGSSGQAQGRQARFRRGR